MVRIIITGTPGTLKSEIAELIVNELGYTYVNVHEFIKKHKISSFFDGENNCDVVDIDKFVNEMENYLKDKDNVVLDSHIIHHISSDLCIIAISDIEVIHERLKERGYHEKKIRENLQGEIFEVCVSESEHQNQMIVNTTRGIPKNFIKNLKERLAQLG